MVALLINFCWRIIALVFVLMALHEDSRMALIIGPCLLLFYFAMYYLIGINRKDEVSIDN